MLRIKSTAHQGVFSSVTAAVECYIPFWFGIFPHESFLLLSCISHRRTPVPEWLEQQQHIGKDGNDTTCYGMDRIFLCFTEKLKTMQHQLRCRSWAKVHKKEMPECSKPVISPACFASSRVTQQRLLGITFRNHFHGLFSYSVSITAGVLQILGAIYLHGQISVHGHISH